MRKVVVDEWMSLDGVVQAPGAPEEDTRGGFQHGGWHLRYFDEMSQKWVVEYLTEAGGFLFGRRTPYSGLLCPTSCKTHVFPSGSRKSA